MLRYAPRGGQPQWPRPDDMPEILWQLLGARGVESAQQAQAFLNPGPDQLLDPFGLQGMEAAVQRVRQAAQETGAHKNALYQAALRQEEGE